MNNLLRIWVLVVVLVNINANTIDNKAEQEAVVVISDQAQEKHENVPSSNEVLTVNLVKNNLVISFTNSTEMQEKITKLNIKAQLNVSIGGERKGPGSFSVNRIENDTPDKQAGSLVWKTIKSKLDIVYEEMVMGTYEQNTANDYMIQTFFGRMVFKDNFKLMAKVLPCNSMQFFSTLGNITKENFNFGYKYGVEFNGAYHELDHFEMLTNPYKVQLKWIKSEIVPANAVICSEELEQNYYCGRMHVFDKGLMPAKIADGVAYAHYVVVRSSTDFEYLVGGHSQ